MRRDFENECVVFQPAVLEFIILIITSWYNKAYDKCLFSGLQIKTGCDVPRKYGTMEIQRLLLFSLLASPFIASVFCYLSLIISEEVDANCTS